MIKAMDLWLPSVLRQQRVELPSDGPIHILFSICDHFEPYHQAGGDRREVMRRLLRWQSTFPKVQEGVRDADGMPPRHTFFYPVEQFDRELVSELGDLCKAGAGETEVHLHHDGDTEASLRKKLEKGRDLLAEQGLLSVSPDGGLAYGFIHGNWALGNSHPQGRACGVNNELSVLRQTGCYADFTMPAAPDRCQSRKVNSIYYAKDTGLSRSHDHGENVRVGGAPAKDSLLLVQGPLCLNWLRRKAGIFPRLENADLTERNPPTLERFRLWQKAHVHLDGRPGWIFIKLHTHGCKPSNTAMLLGEQMRAFYLSLAAKCEQDARTCLHFVTAREMVNIIHAGEAGEVGNPGQYRDYRYTLCRKS